MTTQGRSKDQSQEKGPEVFFKTQFVGLENYPTETACPLCDVKFLMPTNDKECLEHLYEKHRLVIGDVEKVASLQSYVNYWRSRFREAPLTSFCTTMLMDCTPDGQPSKNEVYFLLSDCLTEDKTLRYELHQTRLEWALAQQSQERTDKSFQRGCMFCRLVFSGNRATYLTHLSEKHNVQLGRPENLVFIDKLLDKIEGSIQKLRCIYCVKDFKDRNILKEHMRKKLHKRINPKDKSYDDFYIINYLEPGSNWRQKQSDFGDAEEHTGFSSEEEDESSWADWDDKTISVECLICPEKSNDFPSALNHMKLIHNFDFQEETKSLNFYEKVKVVNYLRRQIEKKKCIYCDEDCDDVPAHVAKNNHQKLPTSKVWNQPEFFFPMEDTDSFLFHLDDDNDEVENISRETANICVKD